MYISKNDLRRGPSGAYLELLHLIRYFSENTSEPLGEKKFSLYYFYNVVGWANHQANYIQNTQCNDVLDELSTLKLLKSEVDTVGFSSQDNGVGEERWKYSWAYEPYSGAVMVLIEEVE